LPSLARREIRILRQDEPTPAYRDSVDRRLLPFARRFIVVCALLGLASTGLLLAQAGLLSSGIADGVTSGLLTWLAAVVAARAGLAWAQEVAAHRAAASVRGRLRDEVLARLLRIGPGSRPDPGSQGQGSQGELLHLLTRSLDGLDGYFSRYLPQVVLAALGPLVVLAVVFPVDPVAATIMLVTVPLIPVFLALVGWTTRSLHRRQHAVLARLAQHTLELVRGLPTLKLLGRARAQLEPLARLTDRERAITMRTLRLAFVSSLVLELLATISVALVAVAVGLRLLGDALELRTALFVLILAPEVYLPLRQLGAQHHASADGLAAAEQALALLATPVPSPGRLRVPSLDLELSTVEVAGRGVSVDLRVAPGEVVALAGPSGCGKSTAIGLVLGFRHPECRAGPGRRGRSVRCGHRLVAVPGGLGPPAAGAVPGNGHAERTARGPRGRPGPAGRGRRRHRTGRTAVHCGR
jgi:ATP-binding cassette, subfamily C, bacterial CydD